METRTRLGAVMLVGSTALAVIGCATTPTPTTPNPTTANTTSTLSPQPATSAPGPTALPTFGPATSPTLARTTAALFQPAGPFPADIVEELVVEADIPYTETVQCGGADCQVPLDALAPDGSDLPPTFVVVPGGPV